MDLSNCDREPIQFLGHVQTFGCLIAVSGFWEITHASGTVEKLLMQSPVELLGKQLGEIFLDSSIHDLRTRFQLLSGPDAVERLFGVRLLKDSEDLFDLALYRTDLDIVIEIEPNVGSLRKDQASYLRPMIDRLRKEDTIEALCETAARYIRSMTGFDRVMVYKFHPDQTGEVIAESLKLGVDSFFGLRYPASDIPIQARELYRRNLLRIISDVDDDVSPIYSDSSRADAPIDLSLSGLRAVSPIHIEYLRNMGVQASMSISIVVRGKLWGLFALHHYQPRVLSYETRTASELFAQLFSFILDQIERDTEQKAVARSRDLHDKIMGNLASGFSMAESFDAVSSALRTVIPCDGIARWTDESFHQIGTTPTADECKLLARFLISRERGEVYATSKLSAEYPQARKFLPRAAGLMAIPVSRSPRDYILLFRSELKKQVSWAGNPDKPVNSGPNGDRLNPRKSFETWQQLVEGESAPWTQGEIASADSMRVTIMEVVLRMGESTQADRTRAQERQELLIAELNHRVRNILNLIRGLVNQTKSEARSVTEFTEIVGGRIHALSRAHDQITRENWSPASLKMLIRTEVEAFLGEKSERVSLTGPDALVQPEAFTTLSLVIHELTTNSAKYGALSDSTGEIRVTLEQGDGGELYLGWQESGGPVVRAPTRKGFGSTVIERSIPFELRGTSDVRFELTGLAADFCIPSRYISFMDAPAERARDMLAEGRSESADAMTFSGTALILEDNMIIALDAEEFLLELGASDVSVVSSVAEANTAMDQKTFDFALLDVNIGSETSEAIARRLTSEKIPFAFATGYGEAASLMKHFDNPVVIQKPYDLASLTAGLRKAINPKPS